MHLEHIRLCSKVYPGCVHGVCASFPQVNLGPVKLSEDPFLAAGFTGQALNGLESDAPMQKLRYHSFPLKSSQRGSTAPHR